MHFVRNRCDTKLQPDRIVRLPDAEVRCNFLGRRPTLDAFHCYCSNDGSINFSRKALGYISIADYTLWTYLHSSVRSPQPSGLRQTLLPIPGI